ncbi:MAG TPA: hypothetical protein VFM29_02605, partial [Vicinamibacteria bacterium]|nr:hypothetical protein [Vicinamibacteria bacterium]
MSLQARALLVASLIAWPGGTPASAQSTPPPLHGWVDLHTHPMAHLGFGGKLLHGAPDLQILMPAIPSGSGCHHYVPAANRTDASRECRAIHEGFGLFDNTCGDTLRKEFIRGLEAELGAQVKHQSDGALGHPTFNFF